MGLKPRIEAPKGIYTFDIVSVDYFSQDEKAALTLHTVIKGGGYNGTKARVLFRYNGDEDRDAKVNVKLDALLRQIDLVVNIAFDSEESPEVVYVNFLKKSLPGKSFEAEAYTYRSARFGEEVVMNLIFVQPVLKS